MSIEEHGWEVGEHIRAVKRARLEALVAMRPPCPVDSLPGAYVGLIGAFGTARPAFTCPIHDTFTYNPDTGQVRIISPDDQRFILPESFDLLTSGDQEQPAELLTPPEPPAQ